MNCSCMKKSDVSLCTLLMHISAMINEVLDGGKVAIGDGMRHGCKLWH